MSISNTLEKIGFNKKEILLYLSLIKGGSKRASELATLTKLNRATVYNLLAGLVSKGVVAEDISGKTTRFTPLPASSLHNLLTDTRRDLQEKEDSIKEAVNELSLIESEKTYPVPKMQLIEDADLEKFLYNNTVKWQEAIIQSDGVWWGFQDKEFAEKYQKWIDFTWTTEQSTHQNYLPKVFTNMSKAELEISKKYSSVTRVVKLLNDLELSANVWVCGDYLVMIVANQKPSYLIEIHDNMLAYNIKGILKKLWDTTE